MALLDYQVEPCRILTKILAEKGSALDASETGTGKTFTAIHVAKNLGLPCAIVCPKSVIPAWERACKLEGLEPIFILNYEKLVRGTTDVVFKEGNKFIWNFAGLIIWDEVQRCKSHYSLNSRLLSAAWDTKFIRCLCLSATAAQNPLEMRSLGQVLGLHKGHDFWHWIYKYGARKNRFNGFEWKGNPAQLEEIHKGIFPARGVRIRIKDLPEGSFPENKIMAEAYAIPEVGKLNEEYAAAEMALAELREKAENDGLSAMTIILRARQKAELLKVPILVELAEDLLAEGKSIVVFISFNKTIELLQKYLKTDCIIKHQDAEERQKNIDDFQSNKSKIILCNMMAGGTGLSLHDLEGGHPRVVLLSPTYNAVDMRQALGRAHRAGGRSPVLQKLIYAAGTVEEKVCAKVQTKLNNIDIINDLELSPFIWQPIK